MGAEQKKDLLPPPIQMSEAESEIHLLKSKREELNLQIEKGRSRRKEEESRLEHLNEKIGLEIEKNSALERSIAEKQLVLKSLVLERERLEEEIRREQDLYDEIRREKNRLIKDLSLLDENQRLTERGVKDSQEHLGKLEKKIKEFENVLKSIESEILRKVHEEKESTEKISALKKDIDESEAHLSSILENSKKLNVGLEKEKANLKNLQDKVSEEGFKEKTLKQLNEELRLELMRVEGKLSDRRNSFHQLEFDSQEVSRKIQDLQRDIESKERVIQDQKRQIIRGEEGLRDLERNLKDFREQSQREKKNTTESFQHEKSKQEEELNKLQTIIIDLEDNRRDIASLLESERERIKEISSKSLRLKEAKDFQEEELTQLKDKKDEITEQIQILQEENHSLQKKKSDLEYEVSLFNIKFLDNESKFQQQERDSILEIENLRRTERARVSQERDAMLAEVEALRKKALADIESNSDGVIDKARAEADSLVAKARLFEQDVMTKSQAKLREANEEAQRRDKLTFERFEEADKNLVQLHQEYESKKEKIKQHLRDLGEKGERHLRTLRESQENKLKKAEKFYLIKLEKLKRREYKRVALVRNEEMVKREELLKNVQKEIHENRISELQKIARLKERIHRELEAEKEKQLHEIKETKRGALEKIRDSRRDKESQFEEKLNREKEIFEKTKKERVQNAVSAVFHLVLAQNTTEGDGNREAFKKNIEDAISMSLNGQYHETQEKSEIILDSNPLERKRLLPVIGKYSFRFGLPAAAILLIALDIGSIRSGSINIVSEFIKQQHSAQDLFVEGQKEEWKQKYTFAPKLTPELKDSYTDNVLYTSDYVSTVEKEEFQNSWILALHEFIVNELELSEEVAINYISAEGTMIKEMDSLRKEINPQFLDVGVNKLKEREVVFEKDIMTKISDPEKYDRFKKFRKSFYEEHLKVRDIASRP